MARVRELREYPLFLGKADMKKVEVLHKFTGETRERLLVEEAMQNVLLNHGYEFEGKRPLSYLDLMGGCFNRRKAVLHLTYLVMMQNLVEQPTLASVKIPLIFTPEDDKTTVQTSGGQDIERVEWLQEQWMRSPEVGRAIRNYRKALDESVDEYNMGLVLNLNYHARICSIPMDWKEEYNVHSELRKKFDSDAYSVLDSAYYNKANALLRASGEFWKELDATALGRFFRLTLEEEAEGLGGKKRNN